ncbi:MAG: DUF6600 domain-containing protein [Myxococcales bacterium]
MLRKLLALLVLVPLAARADDWNDGQWSGDDEYSWQSDAPAPGDPRDGYGAQDPYGQPAPPADQYGSQQYEYGWQDRGSRGWSRDDDSSAGPSMDDFRSGLDRYGRWVDTREYGWVWQPTQVNYRWQPYWDGRWMWTTAGWTWVTDEPWGWATYHYGRWAMLDGAGWVWLPGRVWGPAWVAWRWGGGYAGWCPLGPRGAVYLQPRTWVFVETPYFMTPVRHHAVPVSVVATVWTRAQPMPVVRPSPRAGPPPRIVEQHTRVPVRAIPIVEADSRSSTRPLSSGVLPVWRPKTVPYSRPVGSVPSGPPARAEPGNPGVARGWREHFPAAQQPRPSAPATQPPRPSAPMPQPARSAAPAVRPPDARPAPRAERDERGSSARPHAEPLNEARERERK